MPEVRYEYYSGSGNLFLITALMAGEIARCTPEQIVEVVKRSKFRVDGIVLIELFQKELPGLKYKMHYFNSDGTRASMCGNGLRCAMKYVCEQIGDQSSKIDMETDCGPRSGYPISGSDHVLVEMGAYSLSNSVRARSIHLPNYGDIELWEVNTGVPHVVIPVADVASLDVAALGRAIRYHAAFAPQGVNVNFVDLSSAGQIRIRTYERGVEDETGACGTGAVASSLAAAAQAGQGGCFDIFFVSGEVGSCRAVDSGETSCGGRMVAMTLSASAVWSPEKYVTMSLYEKAT